MRGPAFAARSSSRQSSFQLLAGLALLITATLEAPRSASACSSPPPAPPPPPQIIHVGGDDYDVRIQGFSTFATPAGETCACGLTLGGLPITGARFVDAGTSDPVPQFGVFAMDSSVTSELDAAQPTGTWQGFSAPLSAALPGGLPLDVVFTVQAARIRDRSLGKGGPHGSTCVS